MQLSPRAVRIAVGALIALELVVLVAMAMGAADIPEYSVMVGDDDVVIEVVDQRISGAVSVSRVVTPIDGWVVVRADWGDGKPAELMGAAPVSKGENLNVPVPIDISVELPPAAFVSVIADRGLIGEFEYITGSDDDFVVLDEGADNMSMGGDEIPVDPDTIMTEPMDWLLVTGEQEVAEHFAITSFDVVAAAFDANISSAQWNASGTEIEVQGVTAPQDSWVAIILVGTDDDNLNETIGYAPVPAGHTEHLTVQTTQGPDAGYVSALLVADLGAPGVFEIHPAEPGRSVDAPYLVLSYFVWRDVVPAR